MHQIVFSKRTDKEWVVAVDNSVVLNAWDAELGALCAVGMQLRLIEAGKLSESSVIELGPGVTEADLLRGYQLAMRLDLYRARAEDRANTRPPLPARS